jgi:hypothetical protein
MAAIWRRRGNYFPCRQIADRKYRLALRAAATGSKSASRSWRLADLHLNINKNKNIILYIIIYYY